MKHRKRLKELRNNALAVACVALAGWSASASAATPVRLALDWSSYMAYHAPILMAEKKGYFQEQGLEVSNLLTRGSKDTATDVGTDQADIGWADLTTSMYSMISGVPIKAIATIQHKNATGLVVLAASSIHGAADLKGRRIGSTPGGSDSTVLPAFLAANGLKPLDVTIVNTPSNGKLASLMAGKVDAISGQGWYYAPYVEEAGKPARTLLYTDMGIQLLDHGLISNDTYIKQNKATIQKFLVAYKKGLQYTIDHQSEACAEVVSKVKMGYAQSLCERQLKLWLPLLQDAASSRQRWGWNDPAMWNKTYDFLEKYNDLNRKANVQEMYTDDMLP